MKRIQVKPISRIDLPPLKIGMRPEYKAKSDKLGKLLEATEDALLSATTKATQPKIEIDSVFISKKVSTEAALVMDVTTDGLIVSHLNLKFVKGAWKIVGRTFNPAKVFVKKYKLNTSLSSIRKISTQN